MTEEELTVPVVLQKQDIRIAIPAGDMLAVEFTITMNATVRDGEIYVTADVPEDTIRYLRED
jgi:hypothetical protein